MIRIVYEVAGRYPAILRCPPGHSLTHILHFNFLQQRHRHTPHHLHHQLNNYLLLTTVVGEVSTPIIISWNFLFNLYITRTLPCLSKCLMHLIFIWIFCPNSLFSWEVQGRLSKAGMDGSIFWPKKKYLQNPPKKRSSVKEIILSHLTFYGFMKI